jgi:hypothetical protein
MTEQECLFVVYYTRATRLRRLGWSGLAVGCVTMLVGLPGDGVSVMLAGDVVILAATVVHARAGWLANKALKLWSAIEQSRVRTPRRSS